VVVFHGGAPLDVVPLVVDLYGRRRGVDAFIGLRPPLAGLGHLASSGRYSITSRPSERAEPITMRQAASRSLALRSTIFSCAISRIWSIVTRPTAPPLLVICDPFSSPAAFFRK